MPEPSIEERVARLEARLDAQAQHATRADLAAVEVSIRKDIADLATGIGGDLRGMRQDLTYMRGEMTEIRRLLQRRRWWVW
jgi:hypothetical protein